MKNYLQAFGYLVATSVALTWGGIAHAITLNSSGAWTDGTAINFSSNGTPTNDGTLTGLTTNQLFWGEPISDQGASFYQFDGVSNLELDNGALMYGSPFQIGTFTHHNSPIIPSLLTSATLGLTLDIQGEGSHTLDLAFAHNETPNLPDCDFSGVTICPDRVSLPAAGTPQQFAIGGISYEFQLLGFSQALDGSYDTEFITEEEQDNTTFLFGQLQQLNFGPPAGGGPPLVPEPGTILASGLLMGLGGIAKLRYRAAK